MILRAVNFSARTGDIRSFVHPFIHARSFRSSAPFSNLIEPCSLRKKMRVQAFLVASVVQWASGAPAAGLQRTAESLLPPALTRLRVGATKVGAE